MVSNDIRYSIHAKAFAHLQRMDVRVESEGQQNLDLDEDLAGARQGSLGLEHTDALQFSRFSAEAAAAESRKNHAKGQCDEMFRLLCFVYFPYYKNYSIFHFVPIESFVNIV